MQGCEGDTIASALLANGVRVVARSFKYHRPRGVFTAGVEEPNAVFAVGTAADGTLTPNVRATTTPLAEGMVVRSQSGFPSVNFDLSAYLLSPLAAALPAGFYYKTFLWSQKFWQWCEKYIRRAASRAPPPTAPDPDAYAHRHHHCDILIVGGGCAGLAAAAALANTEAKVVVTEMSNEFGGQLLSEPAGASALPPQWLADTLEKLAAASNITLLANTTIQGYHDYNYLIGTERLAPVGVAHSEPVAERLWKIRAKRVIITTGAIERPLVFAGNDTPGVMLASAVQTYLTRYGVLAGRKILFFINNDSAYAAAVAAKRAGAEVEIADLREAVDYPALLANEKIKIHRGAVVASARPLGRQVAVQLARLRGETIERFASHAYDIVATSGGWTPTVHLFSQARGRLQWCADAGAFKPAEAAGINPCAVAGAANGQMHASACIREGSEAAVAAARACGTKVNEADAAMAIAPPALDASPPQYLAWVPAIHPVGRGAGKHFVDLFNDVTVADILLAAREGYQSVEHMKRYTAAGFGTEQGKTGNINALVVLARALSTTPDAVGYTTYRPQYTPVSYGVVAGANRRALFAQERTTPMDAWHRQHNAVYEDVGDWKRPRYFPTGAEDMDAAVWRECKAARTAVAAMDASTLGKIDVQGADAAEFLDRVYTNMMSTLKVGRCRYGLMLRETGMVFDDGVVARLGENHFHLTTSTGHAAAVMNWLEELLQTEWQDLRVFCNSVTEQWAVVALAGPKAREVLAGLTDVSLGADAFPFMSVASGQVCGVPARIFRVSFSGEVAFEINVPARYGLFVWEQIFARGAAHGITPYGTESMHVLRAEKGFIIVGQDSDGTMIPDDVGLAWMVSKKKTDFIGMRSLARPDMLRDGRMQLVGLLPADPKTVIPEGAQLACQPQTKTMTPTPEGFVTSSYMSPTLQRSMALAVVQDGRRRHGESVYAHFVNGAPIPASICNPVFYDAEGERLHG